MKKVIIAGVGETARVAFDYFSRVPEYSVTAFAVDPEFISDPLFMGKPVIDFNLLPEQYPADAHVLFTAVSFTRMNADRTALYTRGRLMGYRFASLISPAAYISKSAHIGENVFIYDHCSIGPMVHIGNNVVCCSGSLIAHSANIEDNVFLAAGTNIGGFTRIGSGSFIGLGAIITDKITVGSGAFLAAGAVAGTNIDKPNVFRGNPAKDTGLAAMDYIKYI
ncbi:MAG: acetyltransferase [Ignavibacteria bacterium]|nr:acetyltransferase [Ignavibacteria bacterium]